MGKLMSPIKRKYQPWSLPKNHDRADYLQLSAGSHLYPFDLGYLFLQAEIGTGIGVFVEENEYMEVVNFDEDKQAYMGFFRKTATTVGMHLSITYSVKKVFRDKASLGLQEGIFIDRSGSTRGLFIGPRIGFYL